MANAVSASTSSFATTSGYALSFNTSTLMANAVSATSLISGTWTFTVSSTGSVTLNGSPFVSVSGTSASGTGTTTTFVISNVTESTGTNSGALQVAGGVGIGGNLNVGGVITATNVYVRGYAVSTSTAGTLSAQYFGTSLGTVTTLNFATGTTATLVSGTLTLQSAIRPNLLSYTTVSAISPTATTDMITISALNQTLTINTVTGALVDGQKLLLRIKDNGSAQTLSWNAIYRAVGADIPSSTVASKWMYVGVIYNLVGTGSDATPNSRWDVVSLNIEV